MPTKYLLNIESIPTLQKIIELIPVAVFAKNPNDNFKIVIWNKAACDLWQLQAEDVLGKTDYDLFPKQQADFFRLKDQETIAGKKVVFINEELASSNTDKECWVRTWKQPLFDSTGQPQLLLGICQDITALKKSQSESESFENQIQKISQNAPGILYQFRLHPDGKKFDFTYISARSMDLLGINSSDVVKDPMVMIELIHPDDKKEFEDKLLRTLANKIDYDWTGRFVLKTGVVKHMRALSAPTPQADGSCLWDGIITDITALRESENLIIDLHNKINHSSRLAELGELTGGIAHEINTPLGIISLTVDSTERYMTENKIDFPKISDNLRKIKETSFRIAKIILAMKSFIKTEPISRPVTIQLSKVFDEVFAIMAFKLNSTNTKLINENLNGDFNVKGNQILLSQVFVNLISNSIDAIKDEKDRWVKISSREITDKNMIEIKVTDSGLGIPAEFQSRIFESLFTTKVKEGTGLGLSISKKIMNDFKGDLLLDSKAKNTTFVVTIPKA